MARPERVYHQDYIARIRYSNALPPPPCPPKLLEIPNTGLSSGQYTSAGFASRMAREQPLNIEADAELGMPIDLVGLPGVFMGNESIIEAESNPPTLDPVDKALLRPLSTLGKPASITSGVSFLRRTEYMTAAGGPAMRFESSTSKDLLRQRTPKRRRQPDVAKDDHMNIIKHILKGFDLAYPRDAYTGPDTNYNIRGAPNSQEEKTAWEKPRHPSKNDVTLLDAYPVLPDLEAFTDAGGFIVTKFQTNPVAVGSEYDERVDVGLFRPLDMPADKKELFEIQQAEYRASPEGKAIPLPQFDYEFFLPSSKDAVQGIKRKFNVLDPENEDEELYSEENRDTGKRFFRYERQRAYETYQQSGDPVNLYDDNVVIALHDAEPSPNDVPGQNQRLQKAAYVYPVAQRTFIRSRRAPANARLAAQIVAEREEEKVDVIEAVVGERTDEEEQKAGAFKEKYEKPRIVAMLDEQQTQGTQ